MTIQPGDEEARDGWIASREDVALWADDPIELLGLVGVWEAPGAYEPWW